MTGAAGDCRRVVTLERLLIWAVQVQRADIGCQAAGRVGPADFEGRVSACGVYQTMAQGLLGTAVDCIGAARQETGRWLPPDAETIYHLAEALPVPTNFQVLGHARAGTRPDWRPELRPVEVRPIVRLRCGVAVGKIFWTGPDDPPRRQFCRFEYRLRFDEMIGGRRLYRAWWCGLRDLAENLRNGARLRDHVVTGIGAPERPWEKNT